jgi:hypothetical protein
MLAARWREDAQVFRRYGAAGRARMLEHMAAELELSTQVGQTACVDLSTAAELSGFTRAHLRRLIRNGRLTVAPDGAGELRVRVKDLPRKPGHAPTDARAARATCPPGREAVADLLGRARGRNAS